MVLVGGGLVGCETALHLSRNGKRVALVEMRDTLAPDGYFSERLHTLEYLEKDPDIQIYTSARCLAIGPDSVKIAGPDGEMCLKADSVVLSSGMVSRSALRDRFRGTAPRVILAGDCVRASNLREATWQGYNAAMIL